MADKKSWRDIYKVHPAADVFPMMNEAELQELAEDIKANGLQVPITIWSPYDKAEWLIDGRNRLAAIELAGVELKPWWRRTIGAGDVVATIIGLNLKRRHLTYDQRVAIAADLAKIMAEGGKERKKANLKQGEDNPEVPKSEHRGRAVEQAAEKMDVGKTAVAEVIAAEKAEPGTTEKIKKGQVTVAQVRKPKKAASNAPERKRHGHTAALDLALRFQRELSKMEFRLAKLDRDEITPAANTGLKGILVRVNNMQRVITRLTSPSPEAEAKPELEATPEQEPQPEQPAATPKRGRPFTGTGATRVVYCAYYPAGEQYIVVSETGEKLSFHPTREEATSTLKEHVRKMSPVNLEVVQ